jgi:hypothetical protein
MNVMQKLSLWGETHAAARHAEHAAAQEHGEPCEQLRREAMLLRERANRLHREVYMELGSGGKGGHAAQPAGERPR